MRPASKQVAIAILAKAPQAGFAKTRLIPILGAEGAAELQAHMTARAVETACASAAGPVTVWAAPNSRHPFFQALSARFPIALEKQPDGDLGKRMLVAIAHTAMPVLVIGTDCPALTTGHLHDAARALHAGNDVVVIPAEDGGYVLIGMRTPQPELFSAMRWGTGGVMAETRRRIAALGLSCHEPPPLWDVDRPEDIERLRAAELDDLVGAPHR